MATHAASHSAKTSLKQLINQEYKCKIILLEVFMARTLPIIITSLLNLAAFYKKILAIFTFFFKFCVGGWFVSYNFYIAYKMNIKVKANIISYLFIFEFDDFS